MKKVGGRYACRGFLGIGASDCIEKAKLKRSGKVVKESLSEKIFAFVIGFGVFGFMIGFAILTELDIINNAAEDNAIIMVAHKLNTTAGMIDVAKVDGYEVDGTIYATVILENGDEYLIEGETITLK